MSFDPFSVLLIAGYAGVMLYAKFRKAAKESERQGEERERWARIARQREWELSGSELRAHLENVAVTFQLPVMEDSDLRAWAKAQSPESFSFGVHRQQGARGVSLGEPFDHLFTLASSDPDLVRAWFDDDMLRLFRIGALEEHRLQLSLSGGIVSCSARWPGISGEEVAALGTLVAAVANGGRKLCARWVDLGRQLGAQAMFSAAFPLPPLRIPRGSVVVTVALERAHAWRTRISFATVQTAPGARNTGETYLPGISLDRDQLETSIDELITGVSGSDGPYR